MTWSCFMSTRLPLELLLSIFREAAELFVVSDRGTVTSLALTATFFHATVRRIAFRRIVVTKGNQDHIKPMLESGSISHLVCDLTLCCSDWSDSKTAAARLTNLEALRGYSDTLESIMRHLPSNTLLRALQFWDFAVQARLGAVVPASVSHASLFIDVYDLEHPEKIAAWMMDLPSVTHLGVELVELGPGSALPADPEELATCLEDVLAAIGQRIEQLSMRLCAKVSDELRLRYVAALQTHAQHDSRGLDMNRRLRIWWDSRAFDDSDADIAASEEDAREHRDVWSEAIPLAEMDATLSSEA